MSVTGWIQLFAAVSMFFLLLQNLLKLVCLWETIFSPSIILKQLDNKNEDMFDSTFRQISVQLIKILIHLSIRESC